MNNARRIAYPWLDAVGGWFAASLRRLGRAYIAYGEARGRATAIRHLERLNDHTLRDIGLRREEIRSAVGGRTA